VNEDESRREPTARQELSRAIAEERAELTEDERAALRTARLSEEAWSMAPVLPMSQMELKRARATATAARRPGDVCGAARPSASDLPL
jgi:hypothetical protein